MHLYIPLPDFGEWGARDLKERVVFLFDNSTPREILIRKGKQISYIVLSGRTKVERIEGHETAYDTCLAL